MVTKPRAEEPANWLLLLHQLPAKPAYARVKLWRRLQALGAVAVKNAVYALPAGPQAQEDFEWVLKEINEAGGEGMIVEARLLDGLSDDAVRKLFNTAREEDYRALAKEIRALDKHDAAPAQIARLRAEAARIVAIDFFGANGREDVEARLAAFDAPSISQHRFATSGWQARIGRRPCVGDAARRPRRSHRFSLVDPPLHRPRGDIQVCSGQGLSSAARGTPLRHVRSGVHP